MTTPEWRHELSKLRILQFLAEPPATEYGATASTIELEAHAERNVDHDRLLRAAHEEGLIERRTDRHHKSAKPFFITAKGMEYLDEGRRKALRKGTDEGCEADWMTRHRQTGRRGQVAAFLASLPEFRDSPPERVDEISRSIAGLIAPSRYVK